MIPDAHYDALEERFWHFYPRMMAQAARKARCDGLIARACVRDPPLAERSFASHKGVIITIYNDPIDRQAKAVSLIVIKTALFLCRFALPIPPALRSKTPILQENYYGTGYRQAPDFTAAAVLVAVRLLINSTSNSTPMVKRPFLFFLADGSLCLPV